MKKQPTPAPSPATANTFPARAPFSRRLAKRAGTTALTVSMLVGVTDGEVMLISGDANPFDPFQMTYNLLDNKCPVAPSSDALELVKQAGTNPYSKKIVMKSLGEAAAEAAQDKIELAPDRHQTIEQLMQATTPAEATAIVSDYMEKPLALASNYHFPKTMSIQCCFRTTYIAYG